MAGPLTGNVTWAGSAPLAVHGNFTLSATGITRSYTGTITLSGSSTGKTITTNGVSLASIDINGVNCGWVLGSALSLTGSISSFTRGAFDSANYNATGSVSSTFSCSSSEVKTLSLGSSNFSFGNFTFNIQNFTFNKGTSTITLLWLNAAFSVYNPDFTLGAAFDLYNISFTNGSNGLLAIEASLTANTIYLSNNNSTTGSGTYTLSGNLTCKYFAQSFIRSLLIAWERDISLLKSSF
jgi:hypothetical protein